MFTHSRKVPSSTAADSGTLQSECTDVLLGYVQMRVVYAALLAFVIPLAAEQQLGVIEFPNSGSRAAQEQFLTGVLLMHNFEYDDAATAFQKAQKADPGFAMAHWGEALSHYRPVWGREYPAKGRAALEGGSKAARVTSRERAYIGAAEALFGEGSKEERWQSYSGAMERLSREYPDDLEAASLYAVSMFGLAGRSRDTRTYMKIAAIAGDVFLKNPDHPGALHYLIHSFDDPVHAPLGLRYARRYSKVAASAPHAQHMPAHIFLALGMWEECVSSNIDSWNSSEARVKRLGLDSDKRGYHALWWMQYAYLQMGQLDEARQRLAVIEADADAPGTRLARAHHAYLRAHLVIDGQQWDADLAPVNYEGIEARAWGANALAEGMRAAKTGNAKLAADWLAKLRAYADSRKEPARSLPIAILELEGLLLLEDKPAEAIEKLRAATKLEETTPFGYGPPFPPKPSFEMLGDALLSLDRPKEAAEAYSMSLQRAPRRALSMIGLRNAAAASGDADTVARMEAEVRGIQRKDL